MASEEKINLLGMLWYHECLSQREAEIMLESNRNKCCYMVREYKGSLYLSTYSNEMFSHLLITKSRHESGYTLSGHHNLFKTLQELVSHHQRYTVYTGNGEITLHTSCHKDYKAHVINFISDFRGDCLVRIKEGSITIVKPNGTEIGTWLNKHIRQFRLLDDRSQFSFESGRRGKFGEAEYNFKLSSRIYYSLRETVNRMADGRSITAAESCDGDVSIDCGESNQEYKPPVPAHRRRASQHQTVEEHRYDVAQASLPILRTVREQRSTSFPDLSDILPGRLTKRTSSGSTKSNPLSHGTSHDPLLSNKVPDDVSGNYQVPRPASVSPEANPQQSDYQVPNSRPARQESDYQVPRLENDPRNVYQVPKSPDRTYMMPRPAGRQEEKRVRVPRKLTETFKQHCYEDPDKLLKT